ncbi:hypothetical protein KAU33_05735 [Candidatus Dependentiae bacterium]|nr:hypothetical protein [Candidatus Dependentiae bacterium]
MKARFSSADFLTKFFYTENKPNLNKSITLLSDPKDRRYFSKLVMGSLCNYLLLKWHLNKFLDNKKKIPGFVESNLITAMYQLFFMDQTPSYSILNDTVEIIKHSKFSGFANLVNAVLRKIERESGRNHEWLNNLKNLEGAERISILYSHPLWLIKRWIEEFGIENTENYCKFNQLDYPHFIRPNLLKSSAESLKSFLIKNEIKFEELDYLEKVFKLPSGIQKVIDSKEWRSGDFIIQDETSILIGKIFAEGIQGNYADICAAPGLKTQIIYEKIRDSVSGIANDINVDRFSEMKENFINWEIFNIGLYNSDALTLPSDLSKNFDTILLDAPCSNLGVVSSKPDIRWKRTSADIADISKMQLKLLTAAGELCREGGNIFYVTCSVEDDETDNVITTFLNLTDKFKTGDISDYIPELFKDYYNDNKLKILPFSIQKTGFFLVKLIKTRK